MKDPVVIKSYSNGLRLQMREDASFSEILECARDRFTEGRSFFKDAAIALSFTGKELSEEEENRLVELIEETTDLHVLVIYSEDPHAAQLNVRAMSMFYMNAIAKREPAKKEPSVSDFYTVCGNVRAGEEIKVRQNLLILGDVEANAAVRTTKNLIVEGRLLGTAEAGERESGHHFVIAAELAPARLIVDGKRCLLNLSRPQANEKKSLFGKKKQENGSDCGARMIYVSDDGELCEEHLAASSPESGTDHIRPLFDDLNL